VAGPTGHGHRLGKWPRAIVASSVSRTSPAPH